MTFAFIHDILILYNILSEQGGYLYEKAYCLPG